MTTVTYKVEKATTIEQATPEGLVTVQFAAGDITPKTPEETAALEGLVAAGIATRVQKAPASKSTPTAKTTTKVEE